MNNVELFRYSPETHTLTLLNKNCQDTDLPDGIQNLSVDVLAGTTQLDLSEAFFLHSLPDLRKFTNLKLLKIERCHNLTSVEAIKYLPLETLLAGHCTKLEDPSPLLKLKLKVLDLNHCTGFKDFEFLSNFAETLLELNVQGDARVQLAKQSLLALKHLSVLNIRGTGIEDPRLFRHISKVII
jgi:hypothetical protein